MPTDQGIGGYVEGEPNSCGGTCGSNYNCKANLYCYQGYCRNPICKNESDCNCSVPLAATDPLTMPILKSEPTSSPTVKPLKTTSSPIITATVTTNPLLFASAPSTELIIEDYSDTTSPSIVKYIAIGVAAIIVMIIGIVITKKVIQ